MFLHAFVLAVGLVATSQEPMDAGAARAKIIELNRIWGKARVDYDKQTMEKMLAPDFYVQIDDQKISRKEFIDEISKADPNFKTVRFDVQVLTVRKNGDHWDAVIAEKLEGERTDAQGKKHKAYSLWITRDGWKPEGDKWMALYSVACGFENWVGGKEPPFKDWGA